MVDVGFLLLGIALLYWGGDVFVDRSLRLARRLELPPLVIGLTVVAFGTSAPELAATLFAALRDSPEVAFGNVVGSNIANLSLVLGAGALLHPLVVSHRFLRREIPMLQATGLAMLGLAWDGWLARWEGALLLGLFTVYLVVLFRQRRLGPETPVPLDVEGGAQPGVGERLPRLLAGLVLGCGALLLGADRLVAGAVGLARLAGVHERVIGLTVVAFGTSLPEMVSTLFAAARREGELLLGNLVGSNIFNVGLVLGATVATRPLRIDSQTAAIDLAVMIGVSLLAWPLLWTGRRLSRGEGLVLLASYCAYLAYLFLAR